jgi:hypothetical protein
MDDIRAPSTKKNVSFFIYYKMLTSIQLHLTNHLSIYVKQLLNFCQRLHVFSAYNAVEHLDVKCLIVEINLFGKRII